MKNKEFWIGVAVGLFIAKELAIIFYLLA